MANEIASTIQATSIKRHPDPDHDLDPSTSASQKRPVKISNVVPFRSSFTDSPGTSPPSAHPDDEIPLSVLQPAGRSHALPPLPDMRFEQSYLARIKHCQTTSAVAWVTVFDHVIMPLTQGILWNLALFGWRSWNRGVKFQGRGFGARVRRWWWGVNKWKLPKVEEKAQKVREFYIANSGPATGD